MKLVHFRPSAQLDQHFQWPGKEELMKLQLASGEKFQRCDEDGLGLTDTGKWWVPFWGPEDFRKEFVSWPMTERPATEVSRRHWKPSGRCFGGIRWTTKLMTL
jgi:hypothetical protein